MPKKENKNYLNSQFAPPYRYRTPSCLLGISSTLVLIFCLSEQLPQRTQPNGVFTKGTNKQMVVELFGKTLKNGIGLH